MTEQFYTPYSEFRRYSIFQRIRSYLILSLTCLFLFACAHTTVNEQSYPEIQIPESFSLYGETSPAIDRWWEGFGSEELVSLIDAALDGSLTLKQALARLEQSEALAVQAAADRLPDLTLSARTSQTVKSDNGDAVTTRSHDLNLVTKPSVSDDAPGPHQPYRIRFNSYCPGLIFVRCRHDYSTIA